MIEVVNMTWDELKNLSLNEPVEIAEIQECSKAVYGGVSWPGKRPGFAVIIALSNPPRHIDKEVCLLAETEHYSCRELVRQCGVLDFQYMPKLWIGDRKHGAAARFIDEINENRREREQRIFCPSEPFELLEMKPLYSYILDEIKRLLAQDRRRLFLPGDSKIPNYLSGIEPGEIAELELGAYPAIEALAFTAIELRNYGIAIDRPRPRRIMRPRSPMA